MDNNTRQAFLQALQSRGLVGNQTNVGGPQGMDQGRMMMAGRQMNGTQGGAGMSQGPIDQLKMSQPDEAVYIVRALAARLKALSDMEMGKDQQPAQPAPAMA
jgi:hypothetical protein